MEGLPALTLAGWAAKAHALRHQLAAFATHAVVDPAELEPAERIAWTLAYDLVVAGGAA